MKFWLNANLPDGAGITAPNTSDLDYNADIAVGGDESEDGGNGLLVIYWVP